jgi:hypothetical protein
MDKPRKLALGDRVKIVPQHWLRGGEIGRVIRFEQRGQNNWLVKFDTCYPGGGIDGDKLWFDSRELTSVTEQDIAPEIAHYAEKELSGQIAQDLH